MTRPPARQSPAPTDKPAGPDEQTGVQLERDANVASLAAHARFHGLTVDERARLSQNTQDAKVFIKNLARGQYDVDQAKRIHRELHRELREIARQAAARGVTPEQVVDALDQPDLLPAITKLMTPEQDRD